MAKTVEAYWEPNMEGLVKRDRMGGRYRTYAPDTLADRSLVLPPELGERASDVERAIRELASRPETSGVEGISRLLLRSEAIASSAIEGITPSPQQVALAELAKDTPVRGFSVQAQLVANNISALASATGALVAAPALTTEAVVELHRQLLPDERLHGLRTQRNWIGGSSWNPLSARYVPPPPELVAGLMADLAAYANTAGHGALIQAGLVHAQFETIHPFADGNGRTGRALIHTILARRGLIQKSVLPVSLVLATLNERYIAGLEAFRYEGAAAEPSSQAAIATWLEIFVDAARVAAEQAELLAADVAELRESWAGKLAAHRMSQGHTRAPRAGSTVTRVLQLLPEMPVLTATSAAQALSVTFAAAREALAELQAAGVLTPKSLERGTTGYLARDILALITSAERQLASTQFDTRLSPPVRPAPRLR